MQQPENKIEERLGRIEVSVTRIEPRVAQIEERLGRVEVSVARLEPQLAHVASDLAELKGVVKAMDAKFENKFDALDEKFEALSAKIDQNAINAEMRFAKDSELKELRAEVKLCAKDADLKELRADVKALAKELASAKVWALFIAATILGVLARGFHWI